MWADVQAPFIFPDFFHSLLENTAGNLLRHFAKVEPTPFKVGLDLCGGIDLAKTLFPDTASAEALECWAAIWGVVRAPAARALGEVEFKGAPATSVPLRHGLAGR